VFGCLQASLVTTRRRQACRMPGRYGLEWAHTGAAAAAAARSLGISKTKLKSMAMKRDGTLPHLPMLREDGAIPFALGNGSNPCCSHTGLYLL